MPKSLAAALLAAASLWAADGNLLANPGFESGDTGWDDLKDYGSAVGTIDYQNTDAAHTGNYGARVEVTTAESSASNNWKLQLAVPADWDVDSGRIYHLAFWAKGDASNSLTLGINRAGSYATSESFAVSSSWKYFEFYYTPDTSGNGLVGFNIYLAGATGTFDFDDFAVDTVPSEYPSTLTQPAAGAWYTGVYRDLFAELGYSQTAVDTKVENAFQQLFFGDSANEAVYRVQPDTSLALIDNIAGYVLTEGQSYGMMIAVQMDRQDVFDKLWRFAKTKMQNTTGPRRGYFAWKVENIEPYAPYDSNPAPDGEEYFVTSLLFAANRWGSDTGIFDYQAQADSLLDIMLDADRGDAMLPLIHPERRQILFSPAQVDDPYTDPSYHLPAFYRVWDALASDNRDGYFAAMAESSWALFRNASHETTGLFPDYSTFDGEPKATSFNANSHKFSSDAHRVGSNIGFSWAWFMDDTSAMRLVKTELAFFASQGSYKAQYTLDGTADVSYGATSLLAANAAAVLASDRASDWSFVDALWKASTATGEWRYYNGLVQMINLLHVSGKFKAWGSPGLASSLHPHGATSATGLTLARNGRFLTITGAAGAVRLVGLDGRVASRAIAGADGRATLRAPGAGLWVVSCGDRGLRVLVP